MNMGAPAGANANFNHILAFIRRTGIVEGIGNILGGQIQFNLDSMTVSCAYHVGTNFVPPFGIGLGNGSDVMRSEPVIALLVGALELLDDVLDINPSIDVHFEVELLRGMPEDQC